MSGSSGQPGVAVGLHGCGALGRCADLQPLRFARGAPERSGSLEATTGSDGTLWLFVGTDSGFEGRTSLYYDRIEVTLVPV